MPFVDILGKYCVVHHLGDTLATGVDPSAKDYERISLGVDVPGSDQCSDYFYLTRDGRGEDTSKLLLMNYINHSTMRNPSPPMCR